MAFQPNIFTSITFSTRDGWQIIEGYHPEDSLGVGNQGVVVTGNSRGLSKQGWSFTPRSKVNSNNTLSISVADQKRGTVDVNGATTGSVRGFLGPKEFSSEDMAIIEAAQEAGLTSKIRQHIVELGYPVNMMPQTMRSRIKGGANSFSVRFPAKLLELVESAEQKMTPRWRLKKGLLQAEATDGTFEGISKSEFVNILEVTRQTLWSGTIDSYTIIAAARTLLTECNLDFDNYWSRLPPTKSRSQNHSKYPIRPLSTGNYSELIGNKPLWQVLINGNGVDLNSMWAYNSKTGQEVAFGDKPEATRYDGFVFEFPQSVILPVVEIEGQLFVGGRFQKSPNIAEIKVFQAITMLPTCDAYQLLSSEIGIDRPDEKGVVLNMTQVGGPINPNSAHFTSVLNSPYIVNISPQKVTQVSNNKFTIIGGDPNFIFIPLKEAVMNSPHGPTVIAASVLCGTAKIDSLK